MPFVMDKVRRKAKISNRYNQVHLTRDNVCEIDKNTQENITYKRAKRPDLSQQVTTRLQETDMTEWQRQTRISRDMRFPTMWYMRPAKAQTSLRICAV